MKKNQLNKVISLIARTGDKALVMDRETDEVIVMMPLDKYEELLDEAEASEILEDEEGGIFGESDDTPHVENNFPWEQVWDKEAPEEDKVLQEDIKAAKEDSVALPDHALEFAEDWAAEGKRPVAPEESLADVPAEDEDRFYLEPVE